MRRSHWVLGGLLLLCALPATAYADTAVPTAQQQCFQVQFLLRLPGLEARQFIEDVQSLRDIDPADEATTARRITELSVQAAALRRDEALSFARLGPILKSMAGPPPLQSWVADEAESLSQPLRFSKDEAKQARTEAKQALILATLDEADVLKTDTDQHLPTLGLWINLTQGRSGLWAGDVGEVAAALHAALANQKAPRLSVTLARHLRATAPAGTPQDVRSALNLLAPHTGNMGELAPIPSPPFRCRLWPRPTMPCLPPSTPDTCLSATRPHLPQKPSRCSFRAWNILAATTSPASAARNLCRTRSSRSLSARKSRPAPGRGESASCACDAAPARHPMGGCRLLGERARKNKMLSVRKWGLQNAAGWGKMTTHRDQS